MDAGRAEFQQFNLLRAFVRAQNDAERSGFPILGLVPGQPAQIKLHLPLVLRLEAALLQVHCDQASELSVIEEQIDVEVGPIELNPLLSGNEGETGAQFEQEQLQFAEDRVLHIPFEEPVFEPKEVKDIGIFEDQGWATSPLGPEQGQFVPDEVVRLLRECRPFVEHGVDPVAKGADTPAFRPAHFGVKLALKGSR